MRKNFFVIMAFIMAAIAVLGYGLYLAWNTMQVALIQEEELAKKDETDFTQPTSNGKSHEPKKDTEFAQGPSQTQEG